MTDDPKVAALAEAWTFALSKPETWNPNDPSIAQDVADYLAAHGWQLERAYIENHSERFRAGIDRMTAVLRHGGRAAAAHISGLTEEEVARLEGLADQRPEGLDEERLARAIDAHMADFEESPESFDSAGAAARSIARHYLAQPEDPS